MRTFAHTLAICLLVFTLGSEFVSEAVGASDVQRIADAYSRRNKELTELYVEWNSRIEPQASPEELAVGGRRGPYVSMHVRAAFKGVKRFYYQEYSFQSGEPMPIKRQLQAVSYDGQRTRILMDPQLARIFPGDEMRQFDGADQFLAYQGDTKGDYRIFVDDKPFPFRLPDALSAGYEALGHVEPAEDGTPCVVIHSKRDRLWCDPTKNMALRHRDLLRARTGSTALRLRLSDHSEVKPGVWLARLLSCDSFADPAKAPALGGKRLTTTRIQVTVLSTQVPDSVFHLDFPKSVWVNDMSQIPPKNGMYPVVSYRIPSHPEQLETIIQQATAVRAAGEDVDNRKGRFNLLVLLGVNAVCLIAAISFFWWRRTAGSHGPGRQ